MLTDGFLGAYQHAVIALRDGEQSAAFAFVGKFMMRFRFYNGIRSCADEKDGRSDLFDKRFFKSLPIEF